MALGRHRSGKLANNVGNCRTSFQRRERRIRVEGHRSQQDAEKEIAAAPRVNKHRILAYETQARALAMAPLEQGARIDINLPIFRAPARCNTGERMRECLQPFFHNIVIIRSPGISCDPAARGIAQLSSRDLPAHGLSVIQPDHDQRTNTGQYHLQILPAADAIFTRQVGHTPMHFRRQPAQVSAQAWRGFGWRDAYQVETGLPRALLP